MIDLASHEMTMLRQTVRGFVRNRLEPLEQQIESTSFVIYRHDNGKYGHT